MPNYMPLHTMPAQPFHYNFGYAVMHYTTIAFIINILTFRYGFTYDIKALLIF